MSTSTFAAFSKLKQLESETVEPVPANDFRRQWADLGADSLAAVQAVGESGWYILGEEVREFEKSLAAWWGMGHAVGVASGLDAIEIALRILGCGPGDRVLTTPLTAFATTLAIVKLGAVPVFVDTDEWGLIDLTRCRRLLESRRDIGFMVPVHLYGQSLDLEALHGLRESFGIKIVEDCAQSIGMRGTGTVGDLAATSFYPTKNLGAMGDGGAILTNSGDHAAKAAMFRDYGQSAKYRHEEVGYNSRLDELQAALLRRVMLPRLDAWTRRREEIARVYLQGIRHPEVRVSARPSCWHLFPVQVPPDGRNSFLTHLKARNIGVGIHYPVTVPDQPALSGVAHEIADECVEARRVAASEVSLPIHPYLHEEETRRVVEAVNAW